MHQRHGVRFVAVDHVLRQLRRVVGRRRQPRRRKAPIGLHQSDQRRNGTQAAHRTGVGRGALPEVGRQLKATAAAVFANSLRAILQMKRGFERKRKQKKKEKKNDEIINIG